MNRWLTVFQASQKLKKSERQVRNYCRDGRIPGAMLVLAPIPYYRIPEQFEVLPSGRLVGRPAKAEDDVC